MSNSRSELPTVEGTASARGSPTCRLSPPAHRFVAAGRRRQRSRGNGSAARDVVGNLCLLCALAALGATVSRADEVNVAVAANFAAPLQKIAKSRKREWAPGRCLLWARPASSTRRSQARRPLRGAARRRRRNAGPTGEGGDGVPGSRFTYAIGKLVFCDRTAGPVTTRAGY